jgi:hypothetical protein
MHDNFLKPWQFRIFSKIYRYGEKCSEQEPEPELEPEQHKNRPAPQLWLLGKLVSFSKKAKKHLGVKKLIPVPGWNMQNYA